MRSICDVLREIRREGEAHYVETIVRLSDEATDMAKRMQGKLKEYKGEATFLVKEGDTPVFKSKRAVKDAERRKHANPKIRGR